MAKAKKYKGVRLTKPPRNGVPRRREDGRPRETYKKYRFDETRLGFMLRYEAPAVYETVMRMTPKGVFPEPTLRTIEVVCRASGDPSLQKPKFFRYLEEYRTVGICCKRPKRITPAREVYYRALREKKMEPFVMSNKDIIDNERKRIKKKLY